jgi:ArsR family transcriptional regulator
MDSSEVVTALAALAQGTRLAAFRLLVQAGPGGLAATQIAEGLEIAPSLVTQTRAGRSLIYSANFEVMNGVLGFLTENCCGGNACSPVTAFSCSDGKSC